MNQLKIRNLGWQTPCCYCCCPCPGSAGKDRQTERGTEDRSISLAFVRRVPRSPFHIIHPSLFHPFRTLSPRPRCSTRHTSRQTSTTRRPRKRPLSLLRGCDDGGHGFHAQLRPAVAAQTVLGPRRQRRRRGPRRRRDGARRVSRGTQRGPQRGRRRRR